MTSTDDFAGMVAIVTGASPGLGREFARELASSGASVTITARSVDGLHETASMDDANQGPFEIVAGDVTDPALATLAVNRTVDRFGPVDLLVNNAGAMLVGAVADVDLDDWWRVMDVNVRGPVIWTRAVLPGMRERHRGRIINISSPGGFTQHPSASAYCASKAALSAFSLCLAAEVTRDGVTVLAFGPEALTGLARSLFESEAMPPSRRKLYQAYFTADPDELLRHSLTLFRFLVAGGADHLTGHYVGTQLDGFDTPDGLRVRQP